MKSLLFSLLFILVIDTNTTAKHLSPKQVERYNQIRNGKNLNQLQDEETYLVSQEVVDAHNTEMSLIKNKKPSFPFLLEKEKT